MSDTATDTASREHSTPSKTQLHTPGNSPPPDDADAADAFHSERVPEVIKLSQSQGAAVLQQDIRPTDGMYFQTRKAAKAVMAHTAWSPPKNDSTIPRDELADREVVKCLVDAFTDLRFAMDTEGNAYRKRFTPGSAVAYDPWVIENCAWETLVCIDVSVHRANG
jgi:hypothetical protein